ncbi:hypothetical protein BGZ63DRAFT_361906 [Mariannaea sp. PMI_226]|nr:hypothetical protein BGZ63DRAFT_361906 [Mariannaea sp. PMI_226]
MASAIPTSLLLPDIFDPQPLVPKVLGAGPAATTYLLNCPPGTDSNDCGTYNMSVTLGSWAVKTIPPGSAKTGEFDLRVSDAGEPFELSVHCEMSQSLAEACTTINIGGNNDDAATATFSAESNLESNGLATFQYVPVTITAGQELLVASDSPTTDAKSSTSQPTTSAQTSSSTSSPEKNSAAASKFSSALFSISVAGIVAIMVFS